MVKPRQGICAVAFVLADAERRAGDFLVRAGDDEVSMVHADQVRRVLAGEVIGCVVVFPVQRRMQVFGLFQRMGDVALGHAETFRQQTGHQIAVGIVADDEVGAPPQLRECLALDIDRKGFQVRPDLEA